MPTDSQIRRNHEKMSSYRFRVHGNVPLAPPKHMTIAEKNNRNLSGINVFEFQICEWVVELQQY